MTRAEFARARHAARAFLSRYEHGGALKPSFNDYRDANMLPERYYEVIAFTRCTDPLYGVMPMLRKRAARLRADRAYHAEREARNAIARAAYSPAMAAVLDQIDAEFSTRRAA